MDDWVFNYTTESGYEDEIIVPGANSIMAAEMFEEMTDGMEEKIVKVTMRRLN